VDIALKLHKHTGSRSRLDTETKKAGKDCATEENGEPEPARHCRSTGIGADRRENENREHVNPAAHSIPKAIEIDERLSRKHTQKYCKKKMD
jgi:hypothetical protein